MKHILAILLLLCSARVSAQVNKIDSLDNLIKKASSDTQRINLLIAKIGEVQHDNLDSAIALGNKTIAEAQKIGYKKGEAFARVRIAGDYNFKGDYEMAKKNLDIAQPILLQLKDTGRMVGLYNVYGMMNSMQNRFDSSHLFYNKAIALGIIAADNSDLSTAYQNNAIAYQQQSDYTHALENYQKALRLAEQQNSLQDEAYIALNIAITYSSLDDKQRAEQSYLKAVALAKQLDLKDVLAYSYSNLSSLYDGMNRYQEQYDYGMKAAALGKQTGDGGIEASSLSRAAAALASLNRFAEAETLNKQSMVVANESRQPYNIYQTYSTMGTILHMEKKYTAAIPYFEKGFGALTDADLYDIEVGKTYFGLSDCYEKTGDYAKALAAYKTSAKISDSITSKNNVRKATELTLNYEFKKKQQVEKAAQAKKDVAAQKTRNQQYFIIAALGIVVLAVLFIAFIQFRNNRQKQMANLLLQKQKQQTEMTLEELKTTQAQLVQSEKMASLGELTAGIAHEIQNPLNFVNNFSDLNKELLEELKEEVKKGNTEEVKELADSIIDNEEKINHHGRRADAIVKGMLQHSRKNTGQKEPTNINALCDEYLRLSYHGLRAKDRSFTAGFTTDFDTRIGEINVVPQDIGRVLLNLFNNAFYAVNEKKSPQPLKGSEYKPLVSVTTREINSPSGAGGKIEIVVQDNGNGIPQRMTDKIFQPFFTTKPTGEGTGLGLSLSYDIIKAHGGEIRVESEEGKGTRFVIRLG